MSLSKRLCVRSDEVINEEKRQSFDDRVCDDLCEVLLQYLSLKDKLRLECVSKQFQRTIFSKHKQLKYELKIKDSEQTLLKFEAILKKIPTICEIRLNKWLYVWEPNDNNIDHNLRSFYNKMIEVIINNCNKLTHFNSDMEFFSEEVLQRLMDKFGSKLVCLIHRDIDVYHPLLRARNIETLIVHRFDYKLSHIVFNRLKRFRVNHFFDEDLSDLEVFVENNAKTIKHLTLLCNYMSVTDQGFNHLLKIISKLTNLVHLSLKYFYSELNDKLFATHLRQIALNCKHLKSLECNYLFNVKNRTELEELLSPLRQLKVLRRLKLTFSYPYTYKYPIDYDFDDSFDHDSHPIQSLETFSFESFEGFQELTHLEIDFDNSKRPLRESILTDIDIYLPKLQSLKISHKMNATEWTVDVLNRLSKLHTIELFLGIESKNEDIMTGLLYNNRDIKNLITYEVEDDIEELQEI